MKKGISHLKTYILGLYFHITGEKNLISVKGRAFLMFGILVGVQQLSRSSFGFMLTFVKCRQIRHMLHTCMSGVPLMETSVKHRDNALV